MASVKGDLTLTRAGVVELVDTPDLGSGDESRGGSNPSARTSAQSVSYTHLKQPTTPYV